MMNIKDIRTGNLVLHNDSGCTVTILEIENNKVLLETLPKSSYWLCGDVSGILLTSTMLQQLSFTNEEKYDTWRGQGIGIDLKPDGIFYGLRISKSRAKIEYLHQLQNYIADFYAAFRQQKYSLNISELLE